jgi:hypothetical protein
MPVTINKPTFELDAQDREFINLVQNRITSYGQIPYSVPEQLIIDIIKECAKYFFRYGSYRYGQTIWGCLLKDDIKRYTTTNADHNTNYERRSVISYHCKLPPSVMNVIEIYERGGSHDSSVDMLQSSVQLINRSYSMSVTGGFSLVGINNNLYATESVAKLMLDNVYQSCCSVMIAFDFNIVTKDLLIHHEILKDLVIKYISNIHLHNLYEDELFLRYVIAKCKRELKRVIAGHTIDLPGGVTLDSDAICDNLEDIEFVETNLKESSGIGDIILWRQ